MHTPPNPPFFASGRLRVVISCEHGGNRIPAVWRALFAEAKPLLQSHRGFDAGALAVAIAFARAFDAPLFAGTTSRLLIDLNRSPSHPALYSPFTKTLPRAAREQLRATCWTPYRERIATQIAALIDDGLTVLHIACHSFTPVLAGHVRNADIGLLYDPARVAEAAVCSHWRAQLRLGARWRVRMNYPYAGKDDGLATAMRTRFPATAYCGIELEVNQRLLDAPQTKRHRLGRFPDTLHAALIDALSSALIVMQAA